MSNLNTTGCVVIGCRHNTSEFIKQLMQDDIPISAVITIKPEVSKKTDVSGYSRLADELPSSIPLFELADYSMKNSEDILKLQKLKFTVGFCIGWQRIIPSWFLDQAKFGIFGMHASKYYLPGGRGRSPINWSIIQGADILRATVFKYTPHADEGPILDIVDVDINQFDTIHSVQNKCRIVFNRTVKRYWKILINNQVDEKVFPQDPSSWFNKRTPDDGLIHWDDSAHNIYNHIRAQTKPYPGAYTRLKSNKYKIWHAHPFSDKILYTEHKPGTILEQFHDGCLLIQCKDFALYIIDHEITNVKIGDILSWA